MEGFKTNNNINGFDAFAPEIYRKYMYSTVVLYYMNDFIRYYMKSLNRIHLYTVLDFCY